MPRPNSRLAAALALTVTLTVGCATPQYVEDPTDWVERTYERDFLDQPVRLTVWSTKWEVEAADAAAKEAFRAVARVDQAAGARSSIAEVRTLVSGGLSMPVSGELYSMIERSLRIARMTNGAYDPTLGPLELLWRMARKRGRLPSELDLNSARSRTGWSRVDVSDQYARVRLMGENMSLDLSGVQHGAACDEALAQLTQYGFSRSRVEFGRATVVGAAPPGTRAWSVQLPANAGVGELELVNAGVATAGLSETWFELEGKRYSSGIDPTTGIGFTVERVATVVAANGLEADGLAHALRAMGDEEKRTKLTRALEVLAWMSEP